MVRVVKNRRLIRKKQILRVKSTKELSFSKGEKFKIKCVIDSGNISGDTTIFTKIVLHVDKVFKEKNIHWLHNIKQGSIPLDIIVEFVAEVTWNLGKKAVQEVVDYLNSFGNSDEKKIIRGIQTSAKLKDMKLHEVLQKRGIREFFIEDVYESTRDEHTKSYIGYDVETKNRYTIIVQNNLSAEIFESENNSF